VLYLYDSASLRKGEKTMPGLIEKAEQITEISVSSPDQTKLSSLRIDTGIVKTRSRIGATHALFQLFYNICGVLPPVNCIGYHEKERDDDCVAFPDVSKGIQDTYVIFQGLKRPFIKKHGDTEVYIYISKPKFVYKYIPHMACRAKRVEAPENALFAVYVQFDDPSYTEGEIINWEWVIADSGNPLLPEDFKDRYDELRWQK